MNIIDFLIIFMIGLYFVSGMYKGFVWSASTLGVSIVACLLAFLLMGTVSNSIIRNEKLYNSMLSYTEGSEAIYDVELVKSDIKSLSNSEIDEVMSRSNLAYPLKERVYENIMTEAFKAEGITTLGDYFNESIVRVIINIVAFIIVYLAVRVLFTFLICWLDYAFIFPQLRKVDFIIGGAVGLARSIIGLCVIFMLMPIILTVLPFDAIEQLVSSSAIASFFYQSNILLKLIPGV